MSIVKSLLTSCVALAASVSAVAAPQVTVSPASGRTLDSKELLATFNLTPDGAYTVAPDAKATLECLDTGDVFDCTQFSDFMGMAILVKFDADEIVDNGEYEFVVNAGAITVDGEPNEKIVATYTLSDYTLSGSQEYPQITLVSSNPADGAGVAAIGQESLNRVTFVTDNDAAVNYIGWELWDVTDENVPEWIYQGSENRIDPNREGGEIFDRWENGLFISIGGPDRKLIKGHNYRMKLVFCGIGYDPVTNQYPNSITIEKSKELETAINFVGLTNPTEYSPYVYESVSPDPTSYVIETVEQARFTVTYSGPVKPDSFTVHIMTGVSSNAGTYTALGEVDADGYSSIWEFVVDPEIAKELTNPHFSISTKDKDGLYVKGNGGFPLDDYLYSVVYECSIGLLDLVSVAPEEGAVVESLSEIVVSDAAGKVMNFAWNATESARICDMFGAEVRVLENPVAVEGDDTKMKWTFEPITESGNYVLIIPKWYFAIGEEFEGVTSKLTNFMYTVDNGTSGGDAKFDIVPVSVDPLDGATVTEISKVVLSFSDVTYYPMDLGAPTASLVKVDGDSETEVAVSEPALDNDFLNPTVYTFTFAEPVKENGTYVFKVKRGAFCDEVYDVEMGQAGHANDDLAYTFIVDDGGAVEVVVGDEAAVVYLSLIHI